MPVAPDALPSEQDLRAVATLEVVDETGSKVSFGSLYEGHRTIVIFIRHFHCGLCAQYIQQISEQLPPAKLETVSMKLVVIGCGDWQPIKSYKADNNCPYPVYGDPKRAIYSKLGMRTTLEMTPSGQQKRSYLKISQGQQIWGSFKKAISNLSMTTKTGNFTQNGGEFIFGPGNKVDYAYRMQNTEDHSEIADVAKAAGIDIAPSARP